MPFKNVEDKRRAQAKYQSSEKQKKLRASRNRARREMEKKGLVHKGDGKDVDHKNSNANDNSRGNLRVTSRHFNRSYHRTSSGGVKKKNGRVVR